MPIAGVAKKQLLGRERVCFDKTHFWHAIAEEVHELLIK